ncbi:MAG: hypothetical protein LBC74_15250 [Planctomycetaceae bacterium]|jgi:hypothetical protein|nr:hypothetical protein [Planctomycetaceae bacterium]
MRKLFWVFLCSFGVLLWVYVLLFTTSTEVNRITGQVENKSVKKRENKESYILTYDTVIKNDYPFRIRLCGGQLNWCGADGCFRVKTEFPFYLEAKQQTTNNNHC